MDSAIEYLRHHARVMHDRIAASDPQAIARIRAVHELADIDTERLTRGVQRKHCLLAIALELGANDWNHLMTLLRARVGDDFGTLLHIHGYWNIWSASYIEARTIRADHGGYLLPYRRQFMIVEHHYIEALGLDPNDPHWTAIDRNWLEPTNPTARDHLMRTLFQHRFHVDTAG